MTSHPLVLRDGADIIARWQDQDISVAQFCADIANVAAALPAAEHLINTCLDRYKFSVTFFAALVARQINLLPSNRDAVQAHALTQHFDHCIVVSDEDAEHIDHLVDFTPGQHGESTSPQVPGQQTAAIAFTSGSTGIPQPHVKSWEMLSTWREVHWRCLAEPADAPLGLVATVPSWHMYGLEWAMMLPTIAPITVFCGADFFPQDVVAALNTFALDTLLISTPLHLRALTKAPAPARPVRTVLSATAPLDTALTSRVETHLQARLLEIYGCSEVGSLASRRPSDDGQQSEDQEAQTEWAFFDCFDIAFDNHIISVGHPLLPDRVVLADRFNQVQPGMYALQGRASDIVKVAGKRESLAHLNAVLTDIEGVDDGVFFTPHSFGLPDTGRLGALVVAPTLSTQEIKAALTQQLDPVFLPRPLRLVEALPRDTTSKLKHEALSRLARAVDD